MLNLKEEAYKQQEYLTAMRRELHSHPELGCEEFETAKRIERELDSLGIPHSRVAGTGVLGILKGTKSAAGKDKVVALRADIDALPIDELNDVPYCSQNQGVMHACGHDAHTACLLGACRILAAHTDEFAGEIRIIFQHAEEIGRGGYDFVNAGIMKGVDRVFGLHTAYEIPAGTVGIKPGLNNASVDFFRITVHGRSAHVSTPQKGIDALYIACQIVVAVQALVTRCSSPIEPLLVGIGKLEAGTAYNAVAETAVFEGTTRTISQERRDEIMKRINELSENIARTYGGSIETLWTDFTPALINDAGVCKEAEPIAEAMGAKVVTDRPLSLGGDDFAVLNMEAPGAYAYLGTGNPDMPGTLYSNHNGHFDIDESVLPIGAGLYAGYALSRLG